MKKIIVIVLASVTLSACTMPFAKSKKSALDVKSEPAAAIYLNGNHVGTTPFYKDDLKPGEYTVKLAIETNPEEVWQTQVTLKPQLLTNITRFFGVSEDVSSNFTLALEESKDKDTGGITVISLPDSAVVKRDGQPMGFAPVEMNDLPPSDYQITIGSPGFKQLIIPVKAVAGHKLIISAKLAKDKEIVKPEEKSEEATATAILATPPPSPQILNQEDVPSTGSAAIKKPYVTILETPTGWLRVRSEPSGLTDNEIGRVDSGETLPFKQNNNSGWYQIEYEGGEYGWISAQYARLVE